MRSLDAWPVLWHGETQGLARIDSHHRVRDACVRPPDRLHQSQGADPVEGCVVHREHDEVTAGVVHEQHPERR